MKKWFLLIISLISATWVYAENVSVDQAMRVATNFTQQISGNQLRSGQTLQLAYTARPDLRSGGADAYYYVFNNGSKDGYIIVSGDDRAYPILGYSTSGNFSYTTVPDNMKNWLQGYEDEIQYACAKGIEQDPEIKEQWHTLIQGAKLPVLRSQTLLTTAKWNQYMPFNSKCPQIQGKNALTGCVATAMGIVMKYHKYPEQGTGSATTTSGSYKANFGVTYLWDMMLDDYSTNYTDENVDAMATLLYHCGVSCDMKYGVSASSTPTARIIDALTQYFRYDKAISHMEKDDYDASEWQNMITNELIVEHRPVIYHGSGTDGHAFVIDGFNGNMYHVNWGWGGSYDDWFSLTALKPGDSNFTYNQGMIINIKPDKGGQSLNEVRISNANGYTGGLKVNTTPVQGGSFKLTVSAIRCISTSFNASLSVAHFDKDKNLKEVISAPWSYSFNPYRYFYSINFSCKIEEPIEEGDCLYLVSKVGNDDYKIVEGGPSVVDVIDLIAGAKVNTYKVIWNDFSGVTLTPEKGYNADAVTEGDDFAFTIIPRSGYEEYSVTVRVNGSIIYPDSNGRYIIRNIQANQTIEVVTTAPEPEVVYHLVTLPEVEGLTTNPSPGNHQVENEKDFSFTLVLDEEYDQSIPEVTTDRGDIIKPDQNGIYIIKNICEPIVINIDGLRKNTDVANENIDAGKIRVTASDGTICIITPQPMKTYITTFNGSLYKNLGIVSGDTRVQLPNGRYIVIVGKDSFKVIL